MKFKELKRTNGLSVFTEIVNIVSLEAYAIGYRAALNLSRHELIPKELYEHYIDHTPNVTEIVDKEIFDEWYLCEEDKDD